MKVLIKNNIQCSQPFEFQPISCVDIANEINNLDRSKKTSGALSIDIIKKLTGICHTQLAEYFNYMLISCKFPDHLKAVDVSAIHKASVHKPPKLTIDLLVYPQQCLKFSNA